MIREGPVSESGAGQAQKKGSQSERKGPPGKRNDQAFVLTVH